MAEKYRLLSVLMPIYNESRTLRTIISRVLNNPTPLPIELVCVDDASRDQTWEILQQLARADPRIKIFKHAGNRGKAAAIRTAIANMTGDVALIQDADLEYDPRDYPALLAPILEGKADAVFGSRFAFAGQRRVLLFWHSIANRILTTATNMFLDLNLSDMETGYKAVRADILRRIPLKADRFGIEPELVSRLGQWNIRIYEVPISYHGRTVAEGKKIGLKDAFEAFGTLLECNFVDKRFTSDDEYYLLQILRRSRRINRWMFSHFSRFIGSRVLETDCGVGNFTEMLLECPRLVCVDANDFFVEMTQRRFGHLENVRVFQAGLGDTNVYENLRDEKLDTIVCLNVLEHLTDDGTVLRRMFDLLEPGGVMIVLVPAHPTLMSPMDKKIGHLRRYSAPELKSLMEKTGFELQAFEEFNRFGAWGWRWNRLLGRDDIKAGQIRMFNRLVFMARLFDALHLGLGLSFLAVGRKPRRDFVAPRTGESRTGDQ